MREPKMCYEVWTTEGFGPWRARIDLLGTALEYVEAEKIAEGIGPQQSVALYLYRAISDQYFLLGTWDAAA